MKSCGALLLALLTLHVSLLSACDLPQGPDAPSDDPVAASEAAITIGGPILTPVRFMRVDWTRTGTPGYATKIAACTEGDGRLYAMNSDHSIWVSRSSGADGSWRFVTTDTWAAQILCAQNTLWVVNTDRSLWKNVGSDTAVDFQYVGKPGGAKQITAATAIAIFVPYTVFYALNDDNTLWKSPSGVDGSWTQVGRPGGAARIAAGGSAMEARPFAVNGDGSFWLNAGDGCDSYWAHISTLAPGSEITAASAFTVYALAPDHRLLKGSVRNSEAATSVLPNGQPQRCDGHTLVKDQGGRDQPCFQGTCDAGLTCSDEDICRVHETRFIDSGQLGPSTDTGEAKLWLSSDGHWSFQGWVHESGASGHNYFMGLALTFTDAAGRPFTFTNEGFVAGTFNFGSRDSNWNQSGYDRRIADQWDQIKWTGWHANLHVSYDALGVVETVLAGLGIGIGAAGAALFAASPGTTCTFRAKAEGSFTPGPDFDAELKCTNGDPGGNGND